MTILVIQYSPRKVRIIVVKNYLENSFEINFTSLELIKKKRNA